MNEDSLILEDTPSCSSSTDEKEEQKKRFYKIIVIVFILVVLAVLALIFKKNSGRLIRYLLHTIRRVNEINDPWKSLIFIGILITFQLTFVPVQSSFIVMMSFALDSFVHSILIQAISTTFSATATYFMARGCMN